MSCSDALKSLIFLLASPQAFSYIRSLAPLQIPPIHLEKYNIYSFRIHIPDRYIIKE